MPTAVIYARFSCSKQREASIEDQLRVCQEWCAREGYSVVARYCDYAISGRTDERPEFQQMIANAGESDIVLVYMMDRFSRDPYDAPLYKRRLRDRGVRVVSATEAMPDGPEALLMEKIYEGMAAVESAHISQRTRRGMHGNALKCMHNGVKVFGYRFSEDGKYEIDPEEAEVVREVFRRRSTGESPNSIARDLARRGYRTYAGKPTSYSFVRNMLDNEKYVGVYKFGDVRVEGGMPAILTMDEFLRGRDMKGSKMRRNEDWGDYVLSRRAVCTCGMDLVGFSARNRIGKKYEYYRCSSQTRPSSTYKCPVKPIRKDWLEPRVAEELRGMLASREAALAVARAIQRYVDTGDTEEKAEALRKRQADAERKVRNLTNAVAEGMPYELAVGEVRRWSEVAAVAAAELATLESRGTFDVEDFADFLQRGATLGDKELLDAFVWQVIVGDEWVTVVLNYDMAPGEPGRVEFRRLQELNSGFEESGDKEIRTPLPAEEVVRTSEVWLPVDFDVQTQFSGPRRRQVSLHKERICFRFLRCA